jgi:3-hydroxybutyryl-CoA dehydratase
LTVRFAELKVGQTAERSREIAKELILAFAALTGDESHVDEEEARNSPFGTRIAHGMLSAGFLSALIGMDLPGQGTIWVAQAFRFKQPVRQGDTITWRVEILALHPEKKRLSVSTQCRNQRGELVIDGEGTIQMQE